MRRSRLVLSLIIAAGLASIINAQTIYPPDVTDFVLVAYQLSAVQEGEFSTTGLARSPYWNAWDVCTDKLDYQYCDPSCCAGGTVPMDGPLDCQLTVYAAYGEAGLYLYIKVEDDSWVDYQNVVNNQYGDYSQWANDAVDMYFDNQPSSSIYAAYDAGTALGVGTKTPSTRQYLLRFGGSTPPTAMYVNEFNPAYLSDNTLAAFTLTPHTFAEAAATLGIKNVIIGQSSGNTRVQEWLIPWSQIGNPGLASVPSLGTMTACNIGYNDVDVGMTSGVKALRVGKNGDPGGPCIETCDPVNHPNWQNIQYGPMLSSQTAGCTWAEDGVINKLSQSAVANSKIVRNEYFSLDGKRLDFKNGALNVARNTIVINRTVTVNGVVHSALIVK
ncbi:MAG: hypothetical protein PHC61_08395 [Chitinivibrionales bacterium]|nr:hypothetical protein [Chitinivibrionales bacterium]